MTDISKCFVLPENYIAAEHGELREFLLANQEFTVQIDVGLLRRPDAMLVEHLLCAARTWRDHGLSFEVTNLTKANEVIFMSLGLKNHLNWRAAA